MTDKKQDAHAELMTLAEKWLAYARMNPANNEHGLKLRAALDAYARTLTDRIAELEAQLEAVEAGGVTALLPKTDRKPLTNAEITSLYFESLGRQRIQDAALLSRIVRAVEQHHGITAQQGGAA